MERNLLKKFFTVLLIGIIFSLIISLNNVQATNQEPVNINLNEVIESEEKIMLYDAKTNETTEVDMEQLKQTLESQVNTSGGNINSTGSYIPYSTEKEESLGNVISLRSADHASKVTNTWAIPSRFVCRIQAKKSANVSKIGTCAIVGPNLALTAAHMVFDDQNGNAAFQNWTIYPGCNGMNGTNPIHYGTACGWDKVYYSSKWMENHSDQYDWAICVLQSDVGNQLGWLGVTSYGSNSSLNNLDVQVYGYPADENYGYEKDGRYQYTTGDKITTVGTRYFRYSGWTVGGFSGGPIIQDSDNKIVGVHYGLVWNKPTAVRITSEMVDIIKSNS